MKKPKRPNKSARSRKFPSLDATPLSETERGIVTRLATDFDAQSSAGRKPLTEAETSAKLRGYVRDIIRRPRAPLS